MCLFIGASVVKWQRLKKQNKNISISFTNTSKVSIMLNSCRFGSLVEMDFYQLTSNSDILSGGHGRALRIKRPAVDFFVASSWN